jgi:benzaldehyde dehydrogenase (NAD)
MGTVDAHLLRGDLRPREVRGARGRRRRGHRTGHDNEYGFSAAFGRDTARAITVAQRIDSGICHVNGPTVHDEAADALRRRQGQRLAPLRRQGRGAEFTDLRWTTVQTGERHYPF